MKKRWITLSLAAMMACSAFASASAAGLGYVNFGVLMQSHKDTKAAAAKFQTSLEASRKDFAAQSASLATDQEKIDLAKKIDGQLAAEQQKLLEPIMKDIRAKIEEVRKEKGLDYIVAQGSVFAGDKGVDVTSDVVQKLK